MFILQYNDNICELSYPDVKGGEEVRSLVDHMGELVDAQLLVVVYVPLLKHLWNREGFKIPTFKK